jgi:hypothetical protein
MKKKYLLNLLVLITIGLNICKAQSTDWLWAKTCQSDDRTFSYKMTTDANGNTYVAGYFFGESITIGDTTIENDVYPKSKFYIVKYGNDGNQVWVKNVGDDHFCSIEAMATDNNGNLIITGVFVESLSFDGTVAATSEILGQPLCYISKFNTEGNAIVFTKKIEGSTDDTLYTRAVDMLVDNNNNIYICGGFTCPLINFGDTVTGNNISLTTSGNFNYFIAAYNPDGQILFAEKSTLTGVSGPFLNTYKIALNNNGNIYSTGSFLGTIDFGNGIQLSSGGNEGGDIYIVKHSASGQAISSLKIGDDGYDGLSDIVANGEDIFLAGQFSSPSVTVGEDILINPSALSDLFITKLSSNLEPQWTKQISGTDTEEGASLATDGQNIYISALYGSQNVLFDEYTLQTQLADLEISTFVAKYSLDGEFSGVKKPTGNNAYFKNIQTVNNVVYVSGDYKNDISLGDISLNSNNQETSKMFIAKLSAETLHTDKFIKPEFTLYPNPTKDILNISADFEGTKYSIIDTLGRTITTGTLQNNSINVAALPKGLYILKSSNALNTKFIKE